MGNGEGGVGKGWVKLRKGEVESGKEKKSMSEM